MGGILQLKPGREKSLLRRHPWIYSGAIARTTPENIGLGETVEILDYHGDFLARAAYSPHSQIRARVWTWDPEEFIQAEFFRKRLSQAILAREFSVHFGNTNAYRLVHGESDGLPGLIVDRYGDTIVFQCLSSGAEYWRETLAGLLMELTECTNLYERSDSEVRRLEGLDVRKGIFQGEEFKYRIRIIENGLSFWVDIRNGHKTGYYLDQRVNRSRIKGISKVNRVLDCFTYTGGFSINALAGGADRIVAIDSSAESLELAKENLALNATLENRIDWTEGDVFQVLRSFRDRGEKFDLIILDPPKFAPTISQAERAARAYKDINLLAFKLLRRGGFLSTFSCSGGVNEDLFQKIVAGAARDAGVEAQILERLHQGPDHPVLLNFPEGAYLKGFLIRVLE